MQTFGIVLRRHRAKVNSSLHQRVSAFAIDCIQAWGEAFTSRRALYPHINDTYYKIRYKYHIRFPRMDFDPTRVPIFLGDVTDRERQLAAEFPDDESVAASSVYTTDFEETKEPGGYERESYSSSRSSASNASYSINQYSSREPQFGSRGGTYAAPERRTSDLGISISASSSYSNLPKTHTPRLPYHEPSPASSAKQSPSLARLRQHQQQNSNSFGATSSVVGDGDSLLDLDFGEAAAVEEVEDDWTALSMSNPQRPPRHSVDALAETFHGSLSLSNDIFSSNQEPPLFAAPHAAPPIPPTAPETVPWYAPPPVPSTTSSINAPPSLTKSQSQPCVMTAPPLPAVPVMLSRANTGLFSASSQQQYGSVYHPQQSSPSHFMSGGPMLPQLQMTPYTGPVPSFSPTNNTSMISSTLNTNPFHSTPSSSTYSYRGRDTFSVVTPPKNSEADTSFASLNDEVQRMKSQLSVSVGGGGGGSGAKSGVAVVSPEGSGGSGDTDTGFGTYGVGEQFSATQPAAGQQYRQSGSSHQRSSSQNDSTSAASWSAGVNLRSTSSSYLDPSPDVSEDGSTEGGGAGGRVRSGTYYNQQQQQARKRSSEFVPPSSDPSVEIRFFGNQRVVVKKPTL
eukprot:gene25877-32382_t